jgi:hypothetical protein
MHSIIKKYAINTGTNKRLITVTAIRTQNDTNGNPRYKVQVWTDSHNGNIWFPIVKGYRQRKNDDCYIIASYNIVDTLEKFVNDFEKVVSV